MMRRIDRGQDTTNFWVELGFVITRYNEFRINLWSWLGEWRFLTMMITIDIIAKNFEIFYMNVHVKLNSNCFDVADMLTHNVILRIVCNGRMTSMISYRSVIRYRQQCAGNWPVEDDRVRKRTKVIYHSSLPQWLSSWFPSCSTFSKFKSPATAASAKLKLDLTFSAACKDSILAWTLFLFSQLWQEITKIAWPISLE